MRIGGGGQCATIMIQDDDN